MRTTTAPTIVSAGMKENVLPSHASAVVNFRILQGDTVAGVVEHVTKAVDDARVKVTPVADTVSEPSAVSKTTSQGFATLARTTREVFPGTLVAPGLMIGATDSRHYADLCGDVYRFQPVPFGAADLARPHGVDERIAISAYADAVRFYERLLLNAAY